MATNQNLKRANAECEYTPHMISELAKCKKDPIYFINTYVKTQHPAKGIVPFKLFPYQERMIRDFQNNRLTAVLAARQMGKCCSAETPVTVKGRDSGQIKNMSIEDVFLESCPVTQDIYDDNGKVKFTAAGTQNKYLIKTPSGWSPIKKSLKTVPFTRYTVTTKSFTLNCADTHIIISSDQNEVFAKDLCPGDTVLTELGVEPVLSAVKTEIIEEMYDLELDDDHHVYYTNGILSHNTLTSAIYLLWRATFIPDGTYLIASKNMSHATEIASRIRFAYEELPIWLKCGLKYYNRKSIEFDNGSRIICEATTEKTGRGLSITCVTSDTNITVKIDGTVATLPINKLCLLEQPGVSVNEFQHFYGNHRNIEVLTENNEFKLFSGITKTDNQKILKATFSDGSILKATPDHLVLIKSHVIKFKEMRELKPGMVMSTGISVVKIENEENATVFDINDVRDYASFKTNNIISKNCLLIDEIAFVNPRIQEELWTSLVPTLSTGGSAIISSTPNGDTELFAQLWRGATDNGIGQIGSNGFYSSRVYWDEHPERNQTYFDDMVAQIGQLKTRQEVLCLSSDAIINTSGGKYTMEELFSYISDREITTSESNEPSN